MQDFIDPTRHSHKNKKFSRAEKQRSSGQESTNEESTSLLEQEDPLKRDKEFFGQVPKSLILRLYKIYRPDFDMFGYAFDRSVYYDVGKNS